MILNLHYLIKVNDLKLGLTHEFFHAIQYGYESHKLNPSPWLVESTAAWAPQEVFPEITLHLADQALGQYAFYPHYPLDYIGKEGVDEYLLQGHQYGTFIFFQHASLVLNDNDFVLKLHQFIEELTSNDNLSAISALSSFVREEYGVELADLYHSFVARNAVWDYPHQSEIQTALSQRSIGNNNYHIANELSALDRGWLESKNLEPLYRWGGQYIKLGPLAETNIELSFQGSATGNLQSEAKWQLSAVVDSSSGIEYIELPLVGNTIEAQAITIAEGATVWLAISVTSNGKSNKELYPYRYQLAKNGESQAIPSTSLVVEIPLINDAKSGGTFYGFSLWILIFGFMRQRKGEINKHQLHH